jgi:hypothetical protein
MALYTPELIKEQIERINLYRDRISEEMLWKDILTAARTNIALRGALDQVIVLYELGRTE